jgi:hypothetical protein
MLAVIVTIVVASGMIPQCTRSCDNYESYECVMFTVIDARTNAQLCGAITDPEDSTSPDCEDIVPNPYPEGGLSVGGMTVLTGDCTYAVRLADGGTNKITVSLPGYASQSFTVPMDECGHLSGAGGPSEVALHRAP